MKQKPSSVSHRRAEDRKDERVRRTRERIDAAFVELLHRRPYADIRISDICRKSGVGRTTFYAHYAEKDDLLRSQFARRVAPMIVITDRPPLPMDATPFFSHVGSSPQFYRALMGLRGGTAPGVLRDCFEARSRAALGLDSPKPSLRQFAAARFVASSLITVLECWLQFGAKESPADLQKLFSDLVGPGLRSFQSSAAARGN